MAEESVPLNSLFLEVEVPSKQLQNQDNVDLASAYKEDSSTVTVKDETNPFTNIQPRRIRCKECTYYTTENEEKMLRHVRKVHRGEHPFQCYMCDYSTYNKTLFEEHVRIHQGIKPFKCSFCPYRSVSKKNTKKHEHIHRADNPYKCKQCDFIAKHARSFKCHMLAKHGDLNEQMQCTMCAEVFYSEKGYMSHKKGRKSCPECNELFCRKPLVQHRMEAHGVIGKQGTKLKQTKMFSCGLCEWKGNIKPRILLHLIHHPNQEVDDGIVDTTVLRNLGVMAPLTQDLVENDGV